MNVKINLRDQSGSRDVKLQTPKRELHSSSLFGVIGIEIMKRTQEESGEEPNLTVGIFRKNNTAVAVYNFCIV